MWSGPLERDVESFETADSSVWRFGEEAAIQSRLSIAADRLMLGAVAEARSQLGYVQGQIDVIETTRFRWLSRFHSFDAEVSAAKERAEHAPKVADICLVMASEFRQPNMRSAVGLREPPPWPLSTSASMPWRSHGGLAVSPRPAMRALSGSMVERAKAEP